LCVRPRAQQAKRDSPCNSKSTSASLISLPHA
jgi:hypothetical protein